MNVALEGSAVSAADDVARDPQTQGQSSAEGAQKTGPVSEQVFFASAQYYGNYVYTLLMLFVVSDRYSSPDRRYTYMLS